jgi:hypothetical protein
MRALQLAECLYCLVASVQFPGCLPLSQLLLLMVLLPPSPARSVHINRPNQLTRFRASLPLCAALPWLTGR